MVLTSTSSRKQLLGTTRDALDSVAPFLTPLSDEAYAAGYVKAAAEPATDPRAANHPGRIWPDRRWKEVPGFRGLYYVSDRGDIYCTTSGCLALTHGDRKGGLTVRLIRDGKTYWPAIQDVVAKVFVENSDPITHTYVGHLNGHRKDNRPENLVWMRKNQLTQQLLNKTVAATFGNARRAHLEAQDILQIRAMYAAGVSIDLLAVEFSTSNGNVRSIIKRETWWHLPEDMESIPGQTTNIFDDEERAQ